MNLVVLDISLGLTTLPSLLCLKSTLLGFFSHPLDFSHHALIQDTQACHNLNSTDPRHQLCQEKYSNRSNHHVLAFMSAEQNMNRDEWAQLTQDTYSQSTQQQTYTPEGYAPAEAQNSFADYQDSTASPYGDHPTQRVNAYQLEDDDIPEEEIRDFVSSRRQKRKPMSPAKPKEEQPQSKRAERRAKIANENQGEVSATDQPKGLIEWREDLFQVRYYPDLSLHFRDYFLSREACSSSKLSNFAPPLLPRHAFFTQLSFKNGNTDSEMC